MTSSKFCANETKLNSISRREKGLLAPAARYLDRGQEVVFLPHRGSDQSVAAERLVDVVLADDVGSTTSQEGEAVRMGGRRTRDRRMMRRAHDEPDPPQVEERRAAFKHGRFAPLNIE